MTVFAWVQSANVFEFDHTDFDGFKVYYCIEYGIGNGITYNIATISNKGENEDIIILMIISLHNSKIVVPTLRNHKTKKNLQFY